MRLLHALVLAFALMTTAPSPAAAATAAQVVTQAEFALDNFLAALPEDDVTRIYVQNAYAVVVVPNFIKGGFVLGAEHGLGVLLVRDTDTGRFGPPTFVEIFGGSIGLQAGGKSSDLILTVMNRRATEALLDGDVRIGAELSAAFIRVGGAFGAATTTAMGEDLYIFERTAGLFGGASLGGSGIVPQRRLNRDFWGEGTTPAAIVRRFGLDDARTSELQATLLRF